MKLWNWKILAFFGLGALLFIFGSSVWSIKNKGFFQALSIPGNYGEELSRLTKLRESQKSHQIEIGNHQINFAELDWDMFIIRQSLTDIKQVQDESAREGEKLEDILQKYLLGMVIERKLLFQQVHGDGDFSVEDPQRYTRCIEDWQQADKAIFSSFKTPQMSRFLKSSLCERSLLQQYIKEKFDEKIRVTEQEINDQFQKNKAKYLRTEKVVFRHILLFDEATAIKVRGAIHSKNFAEMAQRFSIAPEASNGGRLGPFAKGQTIPVFERAFQMKPQEISPVIRSDYGYHIIMLEAKITKGQAKLEDVRDEIYRQIVAQKRAQEYQAWVDHALAKLPIGSAKIIW